MGTMYWFTWVLGACGPNEQALVGEPAPREVAGEEDPPEEATPTPPAVGITTEAPDLVVVPDEPGDTGAPDPEWTDPSASDFLFDGTIHDFEIELGAGARSDLSSNPYEDVHATFSYDGQEWDVGFRLKGSSTLRTLDGKPSMKVDFHEWDPTARFFGKKRLTLNAMVSDPTMLHEHAYYWMCERLGVPAPRHGYARVWVDGDLYGLYGVIETMDEQFIDRVFPYDDKGSLWEGSGADVTSARDWFDLDEEGLGDPKELVERVEAADREHWLEMIEANFDADALFGYLAMDIVSGNPDGYAFNHHNYHLYYAPLANRWTLLPWGTDRSFTKEEVPVHGSTVMPLLGELVVRCVEDDECEARLDATVLATADAWEQRDLAGFVESSTRGIEMAAEEDPRREYGFRPEDLAEFVMFAPDAVRRQLD